MKKIMYALSFIVIMASSSIKAQQYNGYTLYSTSNGTTAVLLDTNQVAFKTWTGLSAATGY